MTIFLILLFLSSIIFIGPPGMLQWDSQLFILSLAIMLFYFIWRIADNWKGTGAIVGIFGIWAVLTTHNPVNLFPLFLFLLIYFTLIKLIKPQHIPKILNVICIMALVQTGYVFLQMAGKEPLLTVLDGSKAKPVGFMGSLNMIGAFLAFCIPAFFRKRWVYCLPIVLLPLILLISTKGAVISLMVGTIFWLINQKWHWKKKLLVLLIPLIILLGFLNRYGWKVFLFNQRYREYQKIFYVSNHLVVDNKYADIRETVNITNSAFGYGIGSFYNFYPLIRYARWGLKDSPELYGQAHNEYLEGKWMVGWIGMIIAGFFIYALYRKPPEGKYQLIIMTAITVILVNCLINFPLHIPPLAFLIVTYLALREVR